MLTSLSLCLLVATSCVYGLTYQEASQFTSTMTCTPGGRTETNVTVSYNQRRQVTRLWANHVPNHNWACVNPNEPAASSKSYIFKEQPTTLSDDQVYCLPQGPIGIAKNGVLIYNPTTHTGLNAVEEELMDCNGGHADQNGGYHYHALPDNGIVYDSSNSDAQFIGVALDGNPIYSAGPDTDLDSLDICHGTTVNGRYRYIASTNHSPYFLGCFRSTPSGTTASQGQCSGMTSGSACACQYGVVTFKKRSVNPKFSKMQKRATCYTGYCGVSGGECDSYGRPAKRSGGAPDKKVEILKKLLNLLNVNY